MVNYIFKLTLGVTSTVRTLYIGLWSLYIYKCCVFYTFCLTRNVYFCDRLHRYFHKAFRLSYLIYAPPPVTEQRWKSLLFNRTYIHLHTDVHIQLVEIFQPDLSVSHSINSHIWITQRLIRSTSFQPATLRNVPAIFLSNSPRFYHSLFLGSGEKSGFICIYEYMYNIYILYIDIIFIYIDGERGQGALRVLSPYIHI